MNQRRLVGLPSFDGSEPCLLGVPTATPYPEDHKISLTDLKHQIWKGVSLLFSGYSKSIHYNTD